MYARISSWRFPEAAWERLNQAMAPGQSYLNRYAPQKGRSVVKTSRPRLRQWAGGRSSGLVERHRTPRERPSRASGSGSWPTAATPRSMSARGNLDAIALAMAPVLAEAKRQPGYITGYGVQTGPDTSVTFTVWETEEQLEAGLGAVLAQLGPLMQDAGVELVDRKSGPAQKLGQPWPQSG